jgi:hypothetical protein
MNRKKLLKLRAELQSLRRTASPASRFERLAAQLGRKVGKGGKHPMWMSTEFPLRPLSIPHHGGKDLPVGTRNSIIDQLEDDLACWEANLEE